jgi:TP901 family phage tail tape measure protein
MFRATLDGSGFASGMQGINGHLNDLGFRTNAATASLGSLGTIMGTLANPMTIAAAAAAALGTALVASVQAAADWQSSMAGVAKTTGLSGEDLENLSANLLDLSTSMPIAASEIANVAQVAGSLGVAKDDIANFTEVAIKMGVGFEMSADQAATAGAKILTAFNLDTTAENMEKLGNVVNAMGDNFAATEAQVLDFVNRASFLNTTMGQSVQEVSALGTTLISAGMSAETAATGIKSLLNAITSETRKTGGLDFTSGLLGMSAEEFSSALGADMNSTLIELANNIAAIEDPVKRFQTAVTAAGTEGATALLKLAGQQEAYSTALGLTNAEWENGQSLQKTYEAQLSTLDSQMQIFWNTVNKAAVELGTVFLPAITDGVSGLTDLMKITIEAGEAFYDLYNKANDALKPIAELYKYTPGGMGQELTKTLASGAWEGLKDWAGIGKEHAEQMAKEIEENDKLKQAVSLDNPENLAAARAAGINIGNETGQAMADAIQDTAGDAINKVVQQWDEGTRPGKSAWKSSIGEVVGSVNVGGVEIAAVKDATVNSSDVVLKTEGGTEIDRRSIYSGDFSGDPMAAIYDMIKANPDYFGGLTQLQSAEFAGDVGTAESLKIQAAQVDIETTTEARLKELSSIDIETMRSNIAAIEAEIAGLADDIKNIDAAFDEMSIKPVSMTIELETDAAYSEWNQLVSDIESVQPVMSVQVSVSAYAGEIQAMVADAIRSALA